MVRARLSITLCVIAFAPLADAEPCSDPSALREALRAESVRAGRWDLAWGIVYTAGAAAELGIAASGKADRDNTRSLWVGGAKSALGALGHWTAPLNIPVPPPTGDTCNDRAALRSAVERAADNEEQAFWAGHIGGLIINLAGAVVVAELTSWKTGAVSFATGYPVSLLTTYTMPRASWRRIREPSWTANVVASQDQVTLVVAGGF